MKYTSKDWHNRLSERSDLSTSVVHLTRAGTTLSAFQTLFKILDDKKLIGSTTDSGYIIGDTPAVCFQDAPLHSIAQNVWFEQKNRQNNPDTKLRYSAVGLAFKKDYAYKKGTRPVFYEQINKAKTILPKEQWWRIVNFNLAESTSMIDWTHEREWRCPNEFKFDISEVTIILTKSDMYQQFIETCEEKGLDIHKKIKGIAIMHDLLF